MDPNRKTAFAALYDVEEKQAYSNLALNHQMILGSPSSPAFVRELVYGVLENKLYLDYIIGKLVPSGLLKVKKKDLIVLEMGIYQLAFMDSVPEYAAVNESVVLAQKYCKGRDRFINAVLRNYLRKKDEITLPEKEADPVHYLSVKYSYEPWIIRLWLQQYKPEFVEELLAAGNDTPPLTLRVNNLKTGKYEILEKLVERGADAEPGKLCENAVSVKSAGNILDSALYKKGYFSVQDESSMMAVAVLDPKPGETVMDVCAAPGGKTFAMAERMQNNGVIYASDIYPRKLGLITTEAKRLGIDIVKTKAQDASKKDPAFFEKADRVLADVPCSGLGVIRRKPEIKYKKMTGELESLPEKQLEILTAASSYVKPGGVLVYSTCTIAARENQDVVNRFLSEHSEFRRDEMIQLLPNVNHTDGFFICRMIKNQCVLKK